MTKRKRLVLILIFVIYAAPVWWFSLAFLPASSNLAVAAVLTACGLALLGAYILVTRKSAEPRAAPKLLSSAGGIQNGSLPRPLYILLGAEGSGKTSLFVAAGLGGGSAGG